MSARMTARVQVEASDAQRPTRAAVSHGTGGAAVGCTPTVVIADKHPVFRLGVRMVLMRGGFQVVGEAADAAGTLSAVTRERPDLCLLDIYMPGGGIHATEQIKRFSHATQVVILTVSTETQHVLGALHAGAVGYLPKDTTPERLPDALFGVIAGEAALPRTLVASVLRTLREFPITETPPVRVNEVELTARESEILRLLKGNLSTIEISERLSLSPITVRRHISTGVAKLGVPDRDAAIHAINSNV